MFFVCAWIPIDFQTKSHFDICDYLQDLNIKTKNKHGSKFTYHPCVISPYRKAIINFESASLKVLTLILLNIKKLCCPQQNVMWRFVIIFFLINAGPFLLHCLNNKVVLITMPRLCNDERHQLFGSSSLRKRIFCAILVWKCVLSRLLY